jgi:hypothetical protein
VFEMLDALPEVDLDAGIVLRKEDIKGIYSCGRNAFPLSFSARETRSHLPRQARDSRARKSNLDNKQPVVLPQGHFTWRMSRLSIRCAPPIKYSTASTSQSRAERPLRSSVR